MNINPQMFIQMIKQGKNPQQLMLSYLEQSAQSNPMGANLLQMAKNGDSKGLEQFARNFMESQGKDFDTEFNAFKSSLGL